MAREQHDEVVEVPEAVVHRRGREQDELLALSAEQPLHGPVPGCVLVAERVRLVDDDEPVGLLVAREPPRGPGGAGYELLVCRELLEREHLGRQAGALDPRLPALAELRRADDERRVSLLERVLLDEGEADLGLAGADPVGVDDAVVALEDAPCPLVAVALERRELDARHLAAGRRLELLPVELDERPQVDGLGVDEPDRGEEQLA